MAATVPTPPQPDEAAKSAYPSPGDGVRYYASPYTGGFAQTSAPAPPPDMLLTQFNATDAATGQFRIDATTLAPWGGNYGQYLNFKLTATGGATNARAAIDGKTFSFGVDNLDPARVTGRDMTQLGALATNGVPVPGLTASAQFIP